MRIGSLTMKAGNITLVLISLAIIAFGVFVSKRVSALAENIEYQNARTQAALMGKPISSAAIKHPVNK